MTAALALAVVLVIAVAGMTLAMQSQRPTPQARPTRPPSAARRVRDRRPSTPTPPKPTPRPAEADIPPKAPELIRTGTEAEAKVISVVDERTLGPVTRSRLNLRVEPSSGAGFEVTIRVAFPTPEARSRIRVGGTVPVRYDPDEHSRVVLDLPPT